MIDHETYWCETIKYKDKQANTIKTQQSKRVCVDTQGLLQKLLMNADMNVLVLQSKIFNKNEYGIKSKCATTSNSQAKYMLERIHRVIENLVCKFELQNNYPDQDDPWSGIIAAMPLEVRSMYQTKLKATPI